MRAFRGSIVVAAVVMVATAWLCASHAIAAAAPGHDGHAGHDAPTKLCELETGCATAGDKIPTISAPAAMPGRPALARPSPLRTTDVPVEPPIAPPPRRATDAPRAPPV